MSLPTADIASCSHVVASNANEADVIEYEGTGFPVETVGCYSGSIDTISDELVVDNVVVENVSNVLVNVELVDGTVAAFIALIVDVLSIMLDQSIFALTVASAREASKGIAYLMQQLKKNSKKSGNSSVSGCSIELLQGLLNFFSDEACNAFQSKVSHEKIKIAMFEQKPGKAPKLDEFSACCFKNVWSIV
ncbi:hypothetical protein V6N13_039777 [Hibiscus sabdariffa]|uniref:Uncharacterized protein n=1 Tax=Hibiscus sabdariffa TaxID=183260 RepID=A0ABR2SUQ5_9ROSI